MLMVWSIAEHKRTVSSYMWNEPVCDVCRVMGESIVNGLSYVQIPYLVWCVRIDRMVIRTTISVYQLPLIRSCSIWRHATLKVY